jgi:ABC-type bacteriocin/lantibiotic exporter with double-glycine peptidase domain
MRGRMPMVAYIVAASLSAVTSVATIIQPQWFELLFDEAPDDGDGSLETIVAVVVAALACVAFSLLARREWLSARLARRTAPETRA